MKAKKLLHLLLLTFSLTLSVQAQYYGDGSGGGSSSGSSGGGGTGGSGSGSGSGSGTADLMQVTTDIDCAQGTSSFVNYSGGKCVGASGNSQAQCEDNGGTWDTSNASFNSQGEFAAQTFNPCAATENSVFNADQQKKQDILKIFDNDFREKVANGEIQFGSDFKTCKINLWEDHLMSLAGHCAKPALTDEEKAAGVKQSTINCMEGTKGAVLDYELLILAAEYVSGSADMNGDKLPDGEGVKDFWTVDSYGFNPERKNMYDRFSGILTDRSIRRKILKDLLDPQNLDSLSMGSEAAEFKLKLDAASTPGEGSDQRIQEMRDYVGQVTNNDPFYINLDASDLREFQAQMEAWGNKRAELECICMFRLGYTNLSNEPNWLGTEKTQKQRYEEMCPAFYEEDQARQALIDSGDAAGGMAEDTSALGLKYKRLLAYWAYVNKSIKEVVFVSEEKADFELNRFKEWVKQTRWFETEARYMGYKNGKAAFYQAVNGRITGEPLYKFTIYKKRSLLGLILAIIGAIILVIAIVVTAGTLAIVLGVIGGALLVGGIVMEIISIKTFNAQFAASLVTHHLTFFSPDNPEAFYPEAADEVDRDWWTCKGGVLSWVKCKRFRRYLKHPYNSVCNNPTPAAGCVKKWLHVNINGERRILVDPWAPVGTSVSDFITDPKDYANLGQNNRLWETTDRIAKTYNQYMYPIKPNSGLGFPKCKGWKSSKWGQRNLCKKGEEKKPMVTEDTMGWWMPKLHVENGTPEQIFNANELNANKIQLIKEKSGEFITETGFLRADLGNYKNIFNEYVYEFHYLFPKISAYTGVTYPTPGLLIYLQSLQNAFKYLSLTNNAGAGDWGNLLDQYINDLAKTAEAYQAYLSQNAKKDTTEVVSGDAGFTAADLARMGFREWDFATASYGAKVAPGGSNGSSLNGGSTAGLNNSASGNSDDLDFASAVDRFKKREEKRRKEQAEWEKRVGSTERGKRIKKANERFQNAIRRPLSGVRLKDVMNSSLDKDPFNGKLNGSMAAITNLSGRFSLGRGAISGDRLKSASDASGEAEGVKVGAAGKGASKVKGSKSDKDSKDKTNASAADAPKAIDFAALYAEEGDLDSGMSLEAEAKLIGVDPQQLALIRKSAKKTHTSAREMKKFVNETETEKRKKQSLFDIVTNTYIRNYDKVLVRKKKKK